MQQYFAICPSAVEPIPFWPAPEDAPNRCSCSLGKVLQHTLTARNEQMHCMSDVNEQSAHGADLGDLGHMAKHATQCACCGASASISA